MIIRFWQIAIITMLSVAFTITCAGILVAEERTTLVEVELSESFYKALRAEGTKNYSTDKSEEYLRQIAVSARYAVESNLKILKQQKRMIELLEAIKKQPD